MKRSGWHFTVMLIAILCAAPALCFNLCHQEKAPDILLTVKDIRGRDHAPLKPDGSKASVLFFITQDCPVSNRYAPEIQRIARDYQNKRVRFYLVYIDQTAGVKEIEKHLREYGLSEITAIHDARHALVKAVGATVTPEAAAMVEGGVILYRGRINNLYVALGKPRRQVTEHNLRNALDAVLKGERVRAARTEAIGCYIASQN
jgi:thiol-disulfide isomerase/thioredoxin